MGCFLACFGSSKPRKKESKKYSIAELANNRTSLCSKDGNESGDKPEVLIDGGENDGSKLEQPVIPAQTISISSTLDSSFPPNHRYVNCKDDDYEIEERNYTISCRDEEDDDLKEELDELSNGVEDEIVESIESSLNSEEEMSQIKAVKAKEIPPLMVEKETCNSDQYPPNFEQTMLNFKSRKFSGMEVDASLSNWLVSSENDIIAPEKPRSVRIWQEEDRPILGALTYEELKQISASSTPRRSPSRTPDEIPIIGTVGTYWSLKDSLMESGSPSTFKGIPNTTSKYREDKTVKWHSTPFETRLERALNRGEA